MRIDSRNLDLQALADTAAQTSTTTATPASAPSFEQEIASFISEVSQQQDVAELESQKLAAGQGNVHETALALEKADIQMRLLMKGRNKIIEAYQEISRMPI